MKFFTWFLIFAAAVSGLAQPATVSQVTLRTKAELSAYTVYSWQTNLSAVVEESGTRIYRFSPGSAAAADGDLVLTATGVAGRWLVAPTAIAGGGTGSSNAPTALLNLSAPRYVSTFANLAACGTDGPSSVIALGAVAAGDGGGATFLRVAASTYTTNVGIVYNGVGCQFANVEWLSGKPYNIRWAGAKCDGVTADDTAFRTAAGITTRLFIPRGTTYLSKFNYQAQTNGFYITNGLSLYGDPAGGSIIKGNPVTYLCGMFLTVNGTVHCENLEFTDYGELFRSAITNNVIGDRVKFEFRNVTATGGPVFVDGGSGYERPPTDFIKVWNLVGNGDFGAADGWTAGAGWAIGAGVAQHTAGVGATNALYYTTNVFEPGDLVEVYFEISGRTAGSVQVSIGGNLSASYTATPSGAILMHAAETDPNQILFIPSATFDGAIDNVTVKWTTPYEFDIDGLTWTYDSNVGSILSAQALRYVYKKSERFHHCTFNGGNEVLFIGNHIASAATIAVLTNVYWFSHDLVVEDCKFSRTAWLGYPNDNAKTVFTCTGDAGGAAVRNCIFDESAYAIGSGPTNLSEGSSIFYTLGNFVFENNYVRDSGGDYLGVSKNGGSIKIFGNTFNARTNRTLTSLFYFDSSPDNIIIEGNNYEGYSMTGQAYVFSTDNVVAAGSVSRNHYHGMTFADDFLYGGNLTGATFNTLRVQDETFSDCSVSGTKYFLNDVVALNLVVSGIRWYTGAVGSGNFSATAFVRTGNVNGTWTIRDNTLPVASIISATPTAAVTWTNLFIERNLNLRGSPYTANAIAPTVVLGYSIRDNGLTNAYYPTGSVVGVATSTPISVTSNITTEPHIVVNPSAGVTYVMAAPNIEPGLFRGQQLTLTAETNETGIVRLTDYNELSGSRIRLAGSGPTYDITGGKVFKANWDGNTWVQTSDAEAPTVQLSTNTVLSLDLDKELLPANQNTMVTGSWTEVGNGWDDTTSGQYYYSTNVAQSSYITYTGLTLLAGRRYDIVITATGAATIAGTSTLTLKNAASTTIGTWTNGQSTLTITAYRPSVNMNLLRIYADTTAGNAVTVTIDTVSILPWSGGSTLAEITVPAAKLGTTARNHALTWSLWGTNAASSTIAWQLQSSALETPIAIYSVAVNGPWSANVMITRGTADTRAQLTGVYYDSTGPHPIGSTQSAAISGFDFDLNSCYLLFTGSSTAADGDVALWGYNAEYGK